MDKFKAFLVEHKISAHTIVVVWGIGVTLFSTDKNFHDFACRLYTFVPAWVHETMLGLIVPVFTYWKATKGATK